MGLNPLCESYRKGSSCSQRSISDILCEAQWSPTMDVMFSGRSCWEGTVCYIECRQLMLSQYHPLLRQVPGQVADVRLALLRGAVERQHCHQFKGHYDKFLLDRYSGDGFELYLSSLGMFFQQGDQSWTNHLGWNLGRVLLLWFEEGDEPFHLSSCPRRCDSSE